MHHQRSACAATTSTQHRPRQRGRHLGLHHPRLHQHRDQEAGVQHHHHRVVAAPLLHAAALEGPRGVALRDHQLGQPLEADQPDQHREGDQRGHAGSPARASTSSEQKPGPIATTSPQLPGAGRPVAQRVLQHVQHRGRREVADPRSESQVSAVACRGRSSAVSHRLEHLGPARVADPPGDVVEPEPVVGEEPVDVVAQVGLDQRGHRHVEHDPQPAGRDVPAHRPLGVGVEPAARAEHLDRARAHRPSRAPRPPPRRRRRARWPPGWRPRCRRAARSASRSPRRRAPPRRRGGRPGGRAAGPGRPRRRRSPGRRAATASRRGAGRPRR